MNLYIKKLTIPQKASQEMTDQKRIDLFKEDTSLSERDDIDGIEDFLETLFDTSSVYFMRLYPR